MPTLQDLEEQRREAGATYAAKAREYEDAYVNLLALDIALSNRNLKGPSVPSFNGGLPQLATHPDFLPRYFNGELHSLADAQARDILASFTL